MYRHLIKGFLLPIFIVLLSFWPAETRAEFDAATIAAAKKEGQLVMYASLARRYLKEMVAVFEKKFDIKVNATRKGTGGIIKMVTAEKMAGVLRCDIVEQADESTFHRWRKEGLLTPYTTPNKDKLYQRFIEKDGAFTPFRLSIISIGYNPAKISDADAPTTWKGLLDPKWKGRIGIIDPTRGAPGVAWANVMLQLYGWDYFKKFAANNPILLRSGAGAVQALVNGEVDIIPGNDHIMVELKAKKQKVEISYPKEGTIIRPVYVAICKDAKNLNAAKLWVDWLTSKEGQGLLMKMAGYGPMRKDVESRYKRPAGVMDPDKNLTPNIEDLIKNKGKQSKMLLHTLAQGRQ